MLYLLYVDFPFLLSLKAVFCLLLYKCVFNLFQGCWLSSEYASYSQFLFPLLYSMNCYVSYLEVFERLYGYPLGDSLAVCIEKGMFGPESRI